MEKIIVHAASDPKGELRGKQALFDEKVISDYELSLARNQLAVACAGRTHLQDATPISFPQEIDIYYKGIGALKMSKVTASMEK